MNNMLKNVNEPPLVKIKKESRDYTGIIDLSQAVPHYSMPEEAVSFLNNVIRDHVNNRISFYSPDPGFFSLREKISEKIHIFNGYNTDPHDIIVTAGANQAFYMTVSTVFNRGDKVMLIEPYYFNHNMTLNILGIEPVYIRSENIIKPDIEKIREFAPLCKGIVITNPSNPTGYTMTENEIQSIIDIAVKNNLYIISDETYEYFGSDFKSSGTFSDYERLIVITSFSKTYSLTGWRLGYVNCQRNIIDEMLKIQDCMVICACSLSQRLLEFILDNIKIDFIHEKNNELEKKYNICREFKGKNIGLLNFGAFFAYMKTSWDSETAVRKIMQHGVLTVPGSMFEQISGNNIRVSLGNTTFENIKKAFDILEKI
jgi:aspartate/methionine/tyrosine aminotransferase